MELGLHIPNFTWSGGPPQLATTLRGLVAGAEDAGFTRISVMDHVWQIPYVGPAEDPMLEAYTTLGFLAAVTERVRLQTLVTGVVYRHPGMLAKMVTTLDVLSGGRGALGIGAAWYEDEALGLGVPFPPLAERFERLEETLQICLQMWSGEEGPYEGSHYALARTLSSPPTITRPRPPIMIGGSGERKTLRLVAKYADACNLFSGPDAAHKLDVLREHCEREGRDYDEIEKTASLTVRGNDPDGALEHLRAIHELGFTAAYVAMVGPEPIATLAAFAERVIPEISGW